MRKAGIKQVRKWLSEVRGWLEPPGCETIHMESPVHPRKMCCTVGIVHEHRFAFFYWALFAHDRYSRKSGYDFDPPVLVTVDYHDDIGGDCDFIADDLKSLDLTDRSELGLFCWCRLRRLNDGHVAPALYLNMFSDVYVLLKQNREGRRMYPEQATRTQRDRRGRDHTIRYFDRPVDLVRALEADDRHVYLDIDLDYFTREDEEGGGKLGDERLVSRRSIKRLLSFDGRFISCVFPRLVGFTIALEPQYCGGLAQSLEILDILNEELFGRTLCTDDCRWKDYRVMH